MLAIGVLLTGMRGSELSSLEELSIEDEAVWSGDSGVYDGLEDDDSLLIFVSDGVRCDEFSMNISREDGGRDAKYVHDQCTADGEKPMGHEDDPMGWYHMGSIHNLEVGVSYQVTTTAEFAAVPEQVIIELIEGIFGGIGGILGGSTCACCGFLFLVIGLVMALVMKEEAATTYLIDEQGRVILNQQPGEANTDGDTEGGPSAAADWYKQTEK